MPVPTTPVATPSGVGASDVRARRRVAALVAAIWLGSAAPVLLGATSCPIARFLHAPCPGCGMTRAFELLVQGDVAASLAMHPLALPTAIVQLVFAVVTVTVTLRHGTPFALLRTRVGRLASYAGALVLALDVLLWLGRFAGLAHGPVPV